MKTIVSDLLGKNIKRLAVGLAVAVSMAAGAAATQPVAHAGGVPYQYMPCWFVSGNQAITLNAQWSVSVSGTCFRGSTAYVAVYDVTTGTYLTSGYGPWASTPVNGDGTFYLHVAGGSCFDQVKAIAYDPSDGTMSNHSSWTYATIGCF